MNTCVQGTSFFDKQNGKVMRQVNVEYFGIVMDHNIEHVIM